MCNTVFGAIFHTEQVVSISLQQKTGIMCFLNEAIEHLRGPYNQHDDHYQLMRGHLVAVRKVLSQVKPGMYRYLYTCVFMKTYVFYCDIDVFKSSLY